MDKIIGARLNVATMKPILKTNVLDEALHDFMLHLQKNRFFGVIELHYQDGQLMRIKREEVMTKRDLLRLNLK
jgi:hypothetical protein